MRKFVLITAACAVLSAALTACVPTQQTVVESEAPDLEGPVTKRIDFHELHNDTIESFGDGYENPYAYVVDLLIDGSNDDRKVEIYAYCLDDTSKEDAERFAAAVLRRCNDAAVGQNNDLQMSSRTSFGTLWDAYALSFNLYPQSAMETQDKTILQLEIPRKGEIPLNPDIETYEEEWIEQRDIIRENMVYDVNGNVIFY